jgi:putative ABC transport system permease protein
LRSIGARSQNIMRLFVMEGVLQGLISFMIATPTAFLLAQPLARALGRTMLEVDLDFAFNFYAVGIWLLVVLVISVVASIAPSRRATKISVHEVLTY